MLTVLLLLAMTPVVILTVVTHALALWCCGISIEIISLFFGPRLVLFHIGSTQVCLSLIPLGGYVKANGDEHRARSTAVRVVTVVSAPLLVLLVGMLLTGFQVSPVPIAGLLISALLHPIAHGAPLTMALYHHLLQTPLMAMGYICIAMATFDLLPMAGGGQALMEIAITFVPALERIRSVFSWIGVLCMLLLLVSLGSSWWYAHAG